MMVGFIEDQSLIVKQHMTTLWWCYRKTKRINKISRIDMLENVNVSSIFSAIHLTVVEIFHSKPQMLIQGGDTAGGRIHPLGNMNV